jgi:hypothetical protein
MGVGGGLVACPLHPSAAIALTLPRLVVQAVQMLTGLERFVRLVVERESLVPRSAAPTSLNSSADKSPKVQCHVVIVPRSAAPTSLNTSADKSPKVQCHVVLVPCSAAPTTLNTSADKGTQGSEYGISVAVAARESLLAGDVMPLAAASLNFYKQGRNSGTCAVYF